MVEIDAGRWRAHLHVRSALPAAAPSDGIRGYLPSSANAFILNLNPDPRAMIQSYFEVRRCNVIALLKRSYPPNIDKLQARNKMSLELIPDRVFFSF